MIIREAQAGDIERLTNVARLSFIDAYGASMTQSAIDFALEKYHSVAYYRIAIESDTILVALENSEIIGHIQFGNASRDFDGVTDQDIDLHQLFIHPNHYSKGIGSALIKAMFSHDRLADARNVYLDVGDENEKAIALYKKTGFKYTGHSVDYDEEDGISGSDVVLVKKLH